MQTQVQRWLNRMRHRVIFIVEIKKKLCLLSRIKHIINVVYLHGNISKTEKKLDFYWQSIEKNSYSYF